MHSTINCLWPLCFAALEVNFKTKCGDFKHKFIIDLHINLKLKPERTNGIFKIIFRFRFMLSKFYFQRFGFDSCLEKTSS